MLLPSLLLCLSTSAFAADGTALGDLDKPAPAWEGATADELLDSYHQAMEQIDLIGMLIRLADQDSKNAAPHLQKAQDEAALLGAELEWMSAASLGYLEQKGLPDAAEATTEIALQVVSKQRALSRELDAISVMWSPDAGKRARELVRDLRCGGETWGLLEPLSHR